jgi:hypothetical protein
MSEFSHISHFKTHRVSRVFWRLTVHVLDMHVLDWKGSRMT